MLTISFRRSVLLAVTVVTWEILLASGCQQQSSSGTPATPSPGQSSSLAQRAATSAQPTSNPVQTAPKRAQSKPRPSQGPSLSTIYANSLQVNAQHLVAADGARISSCTSDDLAGCRSALQQVSTSATALQRDLDAHPAPACLKSADATLRSAIALYMQGAQLGTKGIDEGSSTQLTEGKSLLDQGTAQLMSASSQLGQSVCSGLLPPVAP